MATNYHLNAAEEAERFARQQRDFEHELRTDPRYQPYLAGYEPASVEAFIKHYAAHKVKCLRTGPGMVKFRFHQVIEYQESAYERLFDIQQKKLFDLQVRWRAGEIALPGVLVGEQFNRWSRYIHACPWLPPITPAEFELYCEYLASPACRDVGDHPDHRRFDNWQEYDWMRAGWRQQQPHPPTLEAHDDYCAYPDWYAYYDARLGAPAGYPFATHPNHKGERQEYYEDLYFADKHTREPPAPYVPDPRPSYYDHAPETADSAPDEYIEQDPARFEAFARAFEPDPEPLIAYRRAWLRLQGSHHSHYTERADTSRENLWAAPNPWPVAAHADWRLGIVAAAQELDRTRLLAALPAVFDDYQFRLATGLALAAPDAYRAYHDANGPEDDDMEEYCATPTYLTTAILGGRELAGEPRDFNY
ncbi:hypothetical protein [Hymenobacter ruricola]|uniref:Uncharacterized protein n=1 Tax=Hymenobacter ruricola TaxID=2791023 RepID=A0ABS0I903_9BACT|nr:hypothetical protein [Hymenobacter ruricola]MBF9223452.1 hypothetical protein [Hymenobacter ruricola]